MTALKTWTKPTLDSTPIRLAKNGLRSGTDASGGKKTRS